MKSLNLDKQPVIWLNGIKLPAPDIGFKILREQLVDSGRNTQGTVVAQTINRRLIKLDGLGWSYLTEEQWGTILQEIEKFRGVLKIWDARTHDFISLEIYWGTSSEEPYDIDSSGRFTTYRNCKCNIIDMGVI